MTRGGVGVGLVAVVLLVAGGAAAERGGGRSPAASTARERENAAAIAEALGIAGRISGAPTGLTPKQERRLASAIVREAEAAGLDPLLVAAVIEVESSFRPGAGSRAGALGLMQVMPETGAWLAARFGAPERGTEPDLLDPEWNVALGVRYLALLVRRFGRVDEALVAYNAGPGRARTLLAGEHRTRWLEGYPRKVLALRDRLRREAGADPNAGGRR